MEVDTQMTWEEIEASFDGEWVLINDPVADEELNILEGRVRYHTKDRNDFDEHVPQLASREIATLFVGQMPADIRILL